MSTIKMFTAVAMLCLLGAFVAAPAMAEVTTNESVPLDMTVFVPCANGGVGEEVHLTGELHTLFITTLDGNGGFHAKTHFQPQGVSGEGLTTGAKYQATGGTQDNTFDGVVGSTYSFVNNFRIIGQGQGNNFLVHENITMTVNANGEVTAEVDNFTTECK